MSATRRRLAIAVIALAIIAALTAGAGIAELSDPGAKLHSQGLPRSAGWG
jgi:hypothetical protein